MRLSTTQLGNMYMRISAFFLFLAMLISGIPSVHAQTLSAPITYTVKLGAGVDSRILDTLAISATQLFSFSTDSHFQNVYTITSSFTKDQLAQKLGNAAEYITTPTDVVSEKVTTNDPGFTDNSQDIDKTWGLAKAGFEDAWAKTTGSASTVVAIIDTGVDGTHEDLQGMNLVPGYDFVHLQSIQGRINSDDNGHGTLITGILAATPSNGTGIAGTNWAISVMPIKALDASGKGNSSVVAEGIVWAVDHGASIINLSLGGIGFGHDTTLSNAISYAFGKNVVIVAAAGNDVQTTGGNLDHDPVFPICDDNDTNMIIGVAATDQNDLKAQFSNYGKNCIDVSAPGKRIISTINFDPFSKNPISNAYAFASGTSLATPFVSGEAALLRSLFPQATNAQIRDRIIATTDPIDDLNLTQCAGQSCRGMLGSGRINAAKAVDWNFSAQTILEGDIVKDNDTNVVYQISGGQKRLISSFVFNQRFTLISIKGVTHAQLTVIPEGPYAVPTEGTLVKMDGDTTVYIISKGLKLPVTYQVFQQRKFNFANINTVTYSEMNSWVLGNFLSPVEGTLLRTAKNKTVYWVVGDTLHPINYQFYIERGLNVFPVLYVADKDLEHFSKGEAYVR